MGTLSTHVLDTAAGRPGAGITVTLTRRDGEELGVRITDADGRVSAIGPERLEAGDYVLRFDTGSYGNEFYPEVVVVFTVADPDQHYHVPVLLSPYGFTTYRGS
jgi:5-hydroxyisourate hydrolase